MPSDTPSKAIEGLKLTGRTSKRLAQNGIETVRDFMSLDEQTVLGWKQTGQTVWDEISKAQSAVDDPEPEKSEAGQEWDPLLGPPPEPQTEEPQTEEPQTEDDPLLSPEPKSKRSRNNKAPEGSGDSVIGLIDWAIDAAAYDKELCRRLLMRAKTMLKG